MATKMALKLNVTYEGTTYDLSDEFALDNRCTLEDDKECMIDRLDAQLSWLDSRIETNTGDDVDCSMTVEDGPGHLMRITVYSDRNCAELIGSGETFAI